MKYYVTFDENHTAKLHEVKNFDETVYHHVKTMEKGGVVIEYYSHESAVDFYKTTLKNV